MRHGKHYTIANSKLLQISISGCLRSRLLTIYRSHINTSMLLVASWRLSPSVSCAFRFLFSDLACFKKEKDLSAHTCVLPNIACIFSAKSLSLENLFCWQISRNSLQSKPGVGNLFSITDRMNCALSLPGLKMIWFYLKLYLYPTMRKSDFFWLII